MRRERSAPRPGWQQEIHVQGLVYDTPGRDAAGPARPYWDESVCYEFTRSEVDALERATYDLDQMCLKAVKHIIDNDLFDQFQVPPAFRDFVRLSWDRDEVTIYCRFDLAFDGRGPPKLLEYNADTPTSLLEAAVIQWHWFKDRQKELGPAGERLDQFNSIHERLIEALKISAAEPGRPVGPWHFPADQVSDATDRMLAAEVTREQLYLQLHAELPYDSAVDTELYKERDDGSVEIHQQILVCKASQRAIVLGKGGTRIKEIGARARAELARIMGVPVHLYLHVKVRPEWEEDRGLYRDIGLDWVD